MQGWCSMKKHCFYVFFSLSILSLFIHLIADSQCDSIILILLVITTEWLTSGAMSSVKVTDNEEVRWWWYSDKRKGVRKCWYVWDSIQKVLTVRHLRHLVTLMTSDLSWPLSLRCLMVGTFCMLSHTYQHFCMPFLSSLYYHHPTSSSSVTLMLLIAHQVSHSVVITSSISII